MDQMLVEQFSFEYEKKYGAGFKSIPDPYFFMFAHDIGIIRQAFGSKIMFMDGTALIFGRIIIN